MRIAIINPSDMEVTNGKIGGNQRFAQKLSESIKKYTKHKVIEINTPFKEHPLSNILKSYFSNKKIDLTDYDLVISIKFPSYILYHKNHISLINHRMRQFDDLWQEYSKEYIGIKLFQRKLMKIFLRVIDRYYLKKAKKIFAQSENIKKRLLKIGVKSEVVYPPESLKGLGLGKQKYLFLPGRLDDKRKRISLAINAMKYVDRNIKLIISGDGFDKETLKKIAKNDKRIEFTGYVEDNKLAKLYRDALAVIFIPAAEDYGLITIEAMKCAKPVITCYDSGGPVELVRNMQNGFVCRPNPKNIAECINYLVNNKSEQLRMGKNALNSAKNITWENYVKKVLSE